MGLATRVAAQDTNTLQIHIFALVGRISRSEKIKITFWRQGTRHSPGKEYSRGYNRALPQLHPKWGLSSMPTLWTWLSMHAQCQLYNPSAQFHQKFPSRLWRGRSCCHRLPFSHPFPSLIAYSDCIKARLVHPLMIRRLRPSACFWCFPHVTPHWTGHAPFISRLLVYLDNSFHFSFPARHSPCFVHAALKRSIAREEPEGQIPSRRRRGMCLSGGSNTYTVFKYCRFRRLRVCCSCMRHALPMRTFASRCVCCPPP